MFNLALTEKTLLVLFVRPMLNLWERQRHVCTFWSRAGSIMILNVSLITWRYYSSTSLLPLPGPNQPRTIEVIIRLPTIVCTFQTAQTTRRWVHDGGGH